MKAKRTIVLLIFTVLGFVGCGSDNSSSRTGGDVSTNLTGKELPDIDGSQVASPGKPGAAVDIGYEVIGNPVVGVPVAINIKIKSAHESLSVQYSIGDRSALMFQDGQVERLDIVDSGAGNLQQLTVIPQREGRVYVNVSVEVPADFGTMIRSMAIPINVGNATKETAVNGELKEGPDSERVISMPAQEAN